ncbi:hypothetical protein WOLCODRAFT_136148 [Wolfiporia cocos MD-104 SS10]|uniref:Uncharacterized protein n=1 Tax=Wolfiporia cocos (strain MD-104) TaxID=742152 RepID=A0A2H3J7T5_WOLCO|nr:hypothetical protein WOLCODRAFT_136148 [Wolfiporia cocos MD-104 SS10]
MIPWPQIAFQPRKLVFRVMLALPNVSGHTEYLDVDFCEHLLETAAANNAIALPSIRTLKIRDVRPSTLAIAARLFPDVRALKITHTGRDDYSTVYRLASWSRLDTVTIA